VAPSLTSRHSETHAENAIRRGRGMVGAGTMTVTMTMTMAVQSIHEWQKYK
jgi:hypothetical protein